MKKKVLVDLLGKQEEQEEENKKLVETSPFLNSITHLTDYATAIMKHHLLQKKKKYKIKKLLFRGKTTSFSPTLLF